MSQLNIVKVPEGKDRNLPIFQEVERLADRIRMQAYNLFSHHAADGDRALDDWLTAEREICWPAAELSEQGDHYSLKVALAGFESGEINVTATPREIIVKAAHRARSSSPKGKSQIQWTEFHSSDAYRRVELPREIDVDKAVATFKNGLLEVTAPHAHSSATAQGKKIAISTDA